MLREENRDPSNIQVTVTQLEEGEELCLHGVFLKIPAEQCVSSRTSLASSSEVSDELPYSLALQRNDNFHFEGDCLEHVYTWLNGTCARIGEDPKRVV